MAFDFEVREVYVTKDGSKFENRKDAVEHILNSVGEDLDGILKADEKVMHRAGAHGVYYMLLALMGTEEKLEAVIEILNRHCEL